MTPAIKGDPLRGRLQSLKIFCFTRQQCPDRDNRDGYRYPAKFMDRTTRGRRSKSNNQSYQSNNIYLVIVRRFKWAILYGFLFKTFSYSTVYIFQILKTIFFNRAEGINQYILSFFCQQVFFFNDEAIKKNPCLAQVWVKSPSNAFIKCPLAAAAAGEPTPF